MTESLDALLEDIINQEKSTLKNLNVEQQLIDITSRENGLKQFAEIFYFVRYDFCHLNFILGERCCPNEFLWAGLAKNLYEELGGKSGQSHNQLYRDFLTAVGSQESMLKTEPAFARQFNQTWETHCRQAPLEEALCAIAIYEAFDIPDYQLLLRVMKGANVSQRGLLFFQVHAVANHFEMFEDIVSWLRNQEGGESIFNRAREFVFETHTEMLRGLVASLKNQVIESTVQPNHMYALGEV